LTVPSCTTIDFEEWKFQHERETNTSYIKTTGEKGDVDSTKTYYYCNRSGYFHPRGNRKRSLKSQGSCKLDAYCTAGIVTTQNEHGISHGEQIPTFPLYIPSLPPITIHALSPCLSWPLPPEGG